MSIDQDDVEWFLVIVIGITLGLIMPTKCSGDDLPSAAVLLPRCQSTLSACDALVTAQDAQIAILRDSVKEYKKIVQPKSDVPLVAWTTAVGGLAGAVGGQLSGDPKGFARGGIVGAIVGFGVGLIGGW